MQIHMNDNDFIVSKTDLKGRIIYGNETFIKMSGYEESELLSAPHNILRHQDMPSIVFKLLWERLKNKKSINAFVLNKCKNGDCYWVFANVTPSFDDRQNVIGYYSVRRKPNPEAIKTIEPIYRELLSAENRSGMDASLRTLNELLDKNGVTYDEFISNIQK